MLITCPKCSAKYKVPSEINLKKGQKVQCSACEHIFKFVPKAPEEIEKKVHLLPPEDAVLSVSTKTERVVFQTKEVGDPVEKNDAIPLPEAFRPVQVLTRARRFSYGSVILWCLLLICLVGIGWLWRDLLIMNNSFVFPLSSGKNQVLPMRAYQKDLKPVVKKKSPVVSAKTFPTVVDPIDEEATVSVDVVVPSLTVQSVRFRKTPTGAVLIEGSLKNTSSTTLPVPEKVYALGYGEDGSLLFEKEIYLPSGVLYPNMEQAFFGTYTSVEKGIQWVDVVLKR